MNNVALVISSIAIFIAFLVAIYVLFKEFLKLREEEKHINRVDVTVIAGQKCPKCGIDGLFKEGDGYFCEECLTSFDKESKEIIISKDK